MDPSLLIIIVFIIAPLIERILKASKQGQELPPPQQRLPQRPAPRPRQTEQTPPPVVVRHDEDERAAAMLPDDLWEILTGEKRAPAQHQPTPSSTSSEADYEEFEEDEDEAYSMESAPGEWISLPPEPGSGARVPARTRERTSPRHAGAWVDPETYDETASIRPLPTRDVPQIVSLEPLEIDTVRRHDEFHRRIEATTPDVTKPRPHRFTVDEDLRRAIIMAEVLGRPKGLE